MSLFIPQLLRGTVLFQETLNPSEVIRTIHRERVSVLVAVPGMMDSLKDRIEREVETRGDSETFRAEMESAAKLKYLGRWFRFRRVHRQFGWKFCAIVSGGAALDSATEEFWRRLGFVVVQGHGMTETTSLVSVNHPFGVGHGSIGKVLPGREMKLDETGEILVRGESIATTYWQHGEATPVACEDGWLRTGDLGALDDKGNLYFKGRKKNVVVTPEGMNVYPQDLEHALRAHPDVKDCVVLPLPREGNAVPGAVILLRDVSTDLAAIVRKTNESLAGYQAIRQSLVWPADDFPQTSTGKPRIGAIQEWALTQLGGTPGAGASSAAVSQPLSPLSVAEIVAKVARQAALGLHGDESLTQDLNLSSLDRVDLMCAMEDRFQVDLNESKFTSATTIRDLEQMVRASHRAHLLRLDDTSISRVPIAATRRISRKLSFCRRDGRQRLQCPGVSGRYADSGREDSGFPRGHRSAGRRFALVLGCIHSTKLREGCPDIVARFLFVPQTTFAHLSVTSHRRSTCKTVSNPLQDERFLRVTGMYLLGPSQWKYCGLLVHVDLQRHCGGRSM